MKKDIEKIIEKIREAKWFLLLGNKKGLEMLDELSQPGFNELTELITEVERLEEEIVSLSDVNKELVEENAELEEKLFDARL